MNFPPMAINISWWNKISWCIFHDVMTYVLMYIFSISLVITGTKNYYLQIFSVFRRHLNEPHGNERSELEEEVL